MNSDNPGLAATILMFRSSAPRQGAAAQSQTRMKCVNGTGLWQRKQRAASPALKPELRSPVEPHMFSSAASFLNCGSEKLKKKKILIVDLKAAAPPEPGVLIEASLAPLDITFLIVHIPLPCQNTALHFPQCNMPAT